MQNTPRLGIAYPEGDDSAVVPRDVFAVAQYIDNNVPIFGSGLTPARPAPATPGRFYFATDEEILYYDTGSNWIAINTRSGEVPIGTVVDFIGDTPPDDYMFAIGTAISRADYWFLFEHICGTKYGAGDGSTTFNLPDYRGRVSVGNDRGSGRLPAANDRGATGGAASVVLTAAQSGSPAHAHSTSVGVGFESDAGGANIGVGAPRLPLTPSAATPNNVKVPLSFGVVPAHQGYDLDNLRLLNHAHTVTVQNSAAVAAASGHENMPPWLCCEKIIKVL